MLWRFSPLSGMLGSCQDGKLIVALWTSLRAWTRRNHSNIRVLHIVEPQEAILGAMIWILKVLCEMVSLVETAETLKEKTKKKVSEGTQQVSRWLAGRETRKVPAHLAGSSQWLLS